MQEAEDEMPLLVGGNGNFLGHRICGIGMNDRPRVVGRRYQLRFDKGIAVVDPENKLHSLLGGARTVEEGCREQPGAEDKPMSDNLLRGICADDLEQNRTRLNSSAAVLLKDIRVVPTEHGYGELDSRVCRDGEVH